MQNKVKDSDKGRQFVVLEQSRSKSVEGEDVDRREKRGEIKPDPCDIHPRENWKQSKGKVPGPRLRDQAGSFPGKVDARIEHLSGVNEPSDSSHVHKGISAMR